MSMASPSGTPTRKQVVAIVHNELSIKKAELAVVRAATFRWLRKHCMRLPAGPLTAQQELEIVECFEMLDEDSSGALDTDELVKAFNLLNFKADKKSVKALMRQVQAEDKDELQLHDFRTLMAHSLGSKDLDDGQRMQMTSSAMPFQEVARAARRNRVLQSVIAGGQKRQQIMDKSQTAGPQSARTRANKGTPRAGKGQRPANLHSTVKLAADTLEASAGSKCVTYTARDEEPNWEEVKHELEAGNDPDEIIEQLLGENMTKPWTSNLLQQQEWALAYRCQA